MKGGQGAALLPLIRYCFPVWGNGILFFVVSGPSPRALTSLGRKYGFLLDLFVPPIHALAGCCEGVFLRYVYSFK